MLTQQIHAKAAALGLAVGVFLNAAPVSAADGAKVFKRCVACHALEKNKTGPKLAGVIGRKCGAIAGYKYGKGYKAACAASGFVIDETFLAEYLANPSKMLSKLVGKKARSKMAFKLRKAEQRDAVIAYLKGK